MNKLFRRMFPSKEMRAYIKMHRRHRKELIKHAKEIGEWDWCWLHESVMMQIRHMYEYYTENNNVWQTEESRDKIIAQLKHVLDLNDEIDHVGNEDLGSKSVITDTGIECTVPDDFRERYMARENKIQNLYEELYHSIGRDIRWWWD